jgi:CAAX prenyl protease-like protein
VRPGEAGTRALLVSALLFGLGPHLWFASLLAGIAYGWLYMHTGNLWTAIAAHTVTEAVLGAWVLLTGSWQFWQRRAPAEL